MSRILIAGEYSYIGDSFSAYARKNGYNVDVIDVRNDQWKKYDFSIYDSIVHVAAIVHKPDKKYTNEEYFYVNTELPFEIAKKAKEEKVKQFVFFSTMSVYGVCTGVITKDTKLQPSNLYGHSKLEAERKLGKLHDDSFCVTVLRPPMIYGKGCKGHYVQLSDFARKIPIFPDFKSCRSMLHIENLNRFIEKVIDEKCAGVYCPQDSEYVSVTNMVKLVAKANSKKIRITKFFNPFVKLAMKMKISVFCKVFGTLVYDKSMCPEFDRIDFETAIELTEK